MAKTILSGYYLAANGAAETLHSAAGRLLGFLISHNQTTAQISIFYDATAATAGTEILVVSTAPEQCPRLVMLPRESGIPFDTGLHVAQGACDVSVWSVDHG